LIKWRFVLAWAFILGSLAAVLTFAFVAFVALEFIRLPLLFLPAAAIFIRVWFWSFDYLEKRENAR